MKKRTYYIAIMLITSFILSTDGCGKKNITGGNNTASNTPSASAVTAVPTQAPASKAAAKVNLNISAAASLKDSMEEISQLYAKEKPDVTLTYNFGSSGILQQQIEQGADVDLFISAAAKQMDALAAKNLIIKDTRTDLLKNDVVLIIPKGSNSIKNFNGLTTSKIKKIAIGEPTTVPAGQYAEEVFTKLGIVNKVKSKYVYGKDVKEVLTWVETGEADAGIVYITDALTSTKVTVAATAPTASHSPVVYPVAVIKSSKNADAAKEFLNFLSSDKGKAVFKKYGFKTDTK